MLILTQAGTDKLKLTTSAAASIDVHASYTDLNTTTVGPGRTNTAIVSAVTTDIVATPTTALAVRNVKTLHIRNKDTAVSCDVAVVYDQNGTSFELHKATLVPGATLEYIEGIGFFTITGALTNLKNFSASNQALSTTDVYLTGSSIAIPGNLPIAGTTYRVTIGMTKTAGTGTAVFNVRYGTAGAIGDTSRATLTFSVGTSVTDTAKWDIICTFRTVGSGVSAVIQADGGLANALAATGFAGTIPIKAADNTGGGFDSTVANSFIGISFNGSTAFAGNATLVRAELLS